MSNQRASPEGYFELKSYLNPMCSLFEKSFTVLGPEKENEFKIE